jgi:hypothetical protein
MSNDPGYPAILCEALTLQQNTHINASFQNVSTNTASTMRMAVQGFAFAPGKIRTQTRKEQLESALERQHYLRPHFMTADIGAAVVGNNVTLPFLFSLDDSGFFEVFKMAVRVYSSLVGAGTLANAAQLATTTLRFKDNDGKQWSPGIAADLPLTWFSTPGLRPNILPVRFMMPPSTQLTIEIANASGVALTYYITLIGRRIFAPSSAAWK